MAINDDLAALVGHPQHFLENNALIIYGAGGSGPADFVLQGTDRNGWRSCAGGGDRPVPLYVMYEARAFNMIGSGPVSAPLAVHYVSMRQYDTVTNQWEATGVTHYLLPAAGGGDFMVTSKINGCTFGIGSDGGGNRLVTHMRPPKLPNNRILLDQGVRAGYAGGRLDVSVMSTQDMNGTVVGKRNGGAWTFYAQRYQKLQGDGTGFIERVNVY